jgi:hypothetical protein
MTLHPPSKPHWLPARFAGEALAPLPSDLLVEHVAVEPAPASAERGHLAPHLDNIVVDTIHAGSGVPADFVGDIVSDGAGGWHNPLTWAPFRAEFIREKDWGANHVAEALARELGVGGYTRVNVARAFLDYGRFPGDTPFESGALDRMAISGLGTRYFNHEQKTRLLSCFDAISEAYDHRVIGAHLKIAVHTYDVRNHVGIERPMVSVVYRSFSYDQERRLPFDVFDQLYPHELAEFTADRRLVGRLVLDLESAGLTTALNHPYSLPDGSVEVRAQVWFFFQFLQRRFHQRYPEVAFSTEYQKVWDMLLDTNLRNAESVQLRSYLHMYRAAPPGEDAMFRAHREAYEHISGFLAEGNHQLVRAYRRSDERASFLGLEVRKDLVWRFADAERREPLDGPDGARWEFIDYLAGVLADAVNRYFGERDPPPEVDRLLP